MRPDRLQQQNDQFENMMYVARETPEYIDHDDFVNMVALVPESVKQRLHSKYLAGLSGREINKHEGVEIRNTKRRKFIETVLGQEGLERLDALEETDDNPNRKLRALVTTENILTAVQIARATGDYDSARRQFNGDIQKRIQATVADNDSPGRRHSNFHVRFTAQSYHDAWSIINPDQE